MKRVPSIAAAQSLEISFEPSKLHHLKVEQCTLAYSVWDKDNSVLLQSIRTRGGFTGQGLARNALKVFLEAVDQAGLVVELAASPLTTSTNRERLVKLYESMGFVLTGSKVNSLGDPMMRRQPGAPAQKPTQKVADTSGPSF